MPDHYNYRPVVYASLGEMLAMVGRKDEAIREAVRATEIDPSPSAEPVSFACSRRRTCSPVNPTKPSTHSSGC